MTSRRHFHLHLLVACHAPSPTPGWWYLGEPFTIRAGQVLAAGTLDIQKHNQLAATKQQAIQRRRPRATVQYIQAKFVPTHHP